MRSFSPRLALTLLLSTAASLALAQNTTPPQSQDPGQSQDQSPQAPQPQVQADQIDQATVDKFGQAYRAVSQLQKQYAVRLESAESVEQAQAIHLEAQEEMVSAVRDKGLTVQEYNNVILAMEQDQDFANRVMQVINQ